MGVGAVRVLYKPISGTFRRPARLADAEKAFSSWPEAARFIASQNVVLEDGYLRDNYVSFRKGDHQRIFDLAIANVKHGDPSVQLGSWMAIAETAYGVDPRTLRRRRAALLSVLPGSKRNLLSLHPSVQQMIGSAMLNSVTTSNLRARDVIQLARMGRRARLLQTRSASEPVNGLFRAVASLLSRKQLANLVVDATKKALQRRR